jgi:ArsR family transcriptional regulator
MLRAARKRLDHHDNVELHRGQLESLPLDDTSVDAVTVCLVLHHVPDPARVLQEIARVLRPGGKALLIDMQRHERSEYRHQMGHVWLGFTEEEITTWFADAGLAAVHVHPIPPDPKAKGPSLFAAIARKSGAETLH